MYVAHACPRQPHKASVARQNTVNGGAADATVFRAAQQHVRHATKIPPRRVSRPVPVYLRCCAAMHVTPLQATKMQRVPWRKYLRFIAGQRTTPRRCAYRCQPAYKCVSSRNVSVNQNASNGHVRNAAARQYVQRPQSRQSHVSSFHTLATQTLHIGHTLTFTINTSHFSHI